MTDKNQIIKEIRAGETSLGIEFGSTRIKAVLVGKEHAPIASDGIVNDGQFTVQYYRQLFCGKDQ